MRPRETQLLSLVINFIQRPKKNATQKVVDESLALDLKPGPSVGEIREALENSTAEGTLRTREEMLA